MVLERISVSFYLYIFVLWLYWILTMSNILKILVLAFRKFHQDWNGSATVYLQLYIMRFKMSHLICIIFIVWTLKDGSLLLNTLEVDHSCFSKLQIYMFQNGFNSNVKRFFIAFVACAFQLFMRILVCDYQKMKMRNFARKRGKNTCIVSMNSA